MWGFISGLSLPFHRALGLCSGQPHPLPLLQPCHIVCTVRACSLQLCCSSWRWHWLLCVGEGVCVGGAGVLGGVSRLWGSFPLPSPNHANGMLRGIGLHLEMALGRMDPLPQDLSQSPHVDCLSLWFCLLP